MHMLKSFLTKSKVSIAVEHTVRSDIPLQKSVGVLDPTKNEFYLLGVITRKDESSISVLCVASPTNTYNCLSASMTDAVQHLQASQDIKVNYEDGYMTLASDDNFKDSWLRKTMDNWSPFAMNDTGYHIDPARFIAF